MYLKKRNAFTMLELVFVIVIIGILSAVAIPRFAVTRDDAIIAKAKTTVASIRNAVATERQKRILRGDLTCSTSPEVEYIQVYKTIIFFIVIPSLSIIKSHLQIQTQTSSQSSLT